MTPLTPPRSTWLVLGALTATQIGIGIWRAMVLFRGAVAGVRPLAWSPALGIDLLTCAALAGVAWWWLPSRLAARRDLAAWGVRFLLVSWLVALAHYVWGLATLRLSATLTWAVLAILFAAGSWVRRQVDTDDAVPATPAIGAGVAWAIVVVFCAAYLPHLVFEYSFTDAKDMWACRAFRLAEDGSLTGILKCADPARAPLHALTLWLGVRDPLFEGRLLPLLMFGAFVLVFYRLVQRVAPRVAPWGVVWLLATDHVLKGQVSTYTGVPEMLSIVIGLAVIIDERALAPTRGFALLIAAVAGAVVALTRRDGFPEFLVVCMVLMMLTRRWRDARSWTAVGVAVIAYLSWVLRPAVLQWGPAFPLDVGGGAGVLYQVPEAPSALRRLVMLLHGAQGQVLSHYGYGAFVWTWIIVAIWARVIGARARERTPAVLYGIGGLAGWLATLCAYAALTLLGHSYMSSLFVVRTGFGRHLVHFYPLCLLSAAALAERLVSADNTSQ